MMASYVHVFGPTVTNNLSVSYDQRKFLQQRSARGRTAQQIGLASIGAAAFRR